MYMDNNEDNDPETIIKADCTFSFQFPKLALLLPESGIYCKHFSILDIGLSPLSIEKEETCYYLADKTDIQPLIVPRGKFAHKGNFGRAFIVAGSHGKMGAAVLAARACLRTGVGLLTMRVPDCGIDVMQASVPEAMAHVGEYGRFAADTENHAVGIGPGIGMSDEMKTLLQDLYSRCKPMVIDADALNLTAACEDLKAALPANSILTPHPAEFDRLFGSPSPNGYRRLQSARHFAQKHRVYIVLKGAYTAIITPESAVYFNPSGNPGMATGGSGDVLTGILTSLLAQGCQPLQACLLGVYLHGLAGDIAAERQSQHAMLPSDLIDCLGRAYKAIQTEDQ
jgi:NAD(P)H-hydrate epimerase